MGSTETGAPWRRHDLLTVAPGGWAAVLEAHPDLSSIRLLGEWAGRGYPVMVRRRQPDDAASLMPTGSLPVALTLPLGQQRRRIAMMLPAELVLSGSRPPPLDLAAGAAPEAWRRSIAALLAGDGEPRVFGSLMWRAITGLEYVRPGSDLDLLWPVGLAETDLLSRLHSIERVARHRAPAIDGEMVFETGEAVQWSELLLALSGRSREVLVKSLDAVRLVPVGELWPSRAGA